MDFFYIDPNDRQRIFRWFRCHLIGCTLIGLVLLSLGGDVDGFARSENASESRAALADGLSDIKAQQPVGWRRTVNGWEHTSNWLASDRTIDDWILQQQTREPQWITRVLEQVRQLSPLTIAGVQLTAIAFIVNVTGTRRRFDGVEP